MLCYNIYNKKEGKVIYMGYNFKKNIFFVDLLDMDIEKETKKFQAISDENKKPCYSCNSSLKLYEIIDI